MFYNPENKRNKVFDEKEYQYYLGLAKEHLANVGLAVFLIKVDKKKTKVDVYGEAFPDEISYSKPVKLIGIVNLKDTSNEAYVSDKGALRYEELGNMEISFLLDDLQQNKINISYGDFIAYPVGLNEFLYFEVVDNADKAFSNGYLFMGYKRYWKKIICTPTEKTFD